jgi:23S rRNA pseudouridine1911/1915/1917 synthase
VRAARGREKRWVVRDGDGATVGEILARAGEKESAVEEGRVFLGRVRVKSAGERVSVGDEVRVGSGSGPGPVEWGVIWERDGMLACNKPAGMPTVPDHGGSSHSLVALAAQSIGRNATSMFVTSRLDREVSGVVVFATSAEAEGRLRRARAEGRYARRYVAIAAAPEGASFDVEPGSARVWDAPIGAGKDARHRAAAGPDAKEARTHWRVVARVPGYALLAVEPQTGRTHQIRVHASHAGVPLLGDRDYGGAARVTLAGGRTVALLRIALHAARVTVPDASGEPRMAAAPVPPELTRAWAELGGASEAWDMALSCELEP